jgi:hypothetical protein
MPISNTEHAKYKFTVKEGSYLSEHGNAPLSLLCEPLDRELSIVGNNGFLSIKLKHYLEYEDARQLASTLNEMIESISYTRIK